MVTKSLLDMENPRIFENEMRKMIALDGGWIQFGKIMEGPVVIRLISLTQGRRRHLTREEAVFVAEAVHANTPWLRTMHQAEQLKNLIAAQIHRGDLSISGILLSGQEPSVLNNQRHLDVALSRRSGCLSISNALAEAVAADVEIHRHRLKGGPRLEDSEIMFIERATLEATQGELRDLHDVQDFRSWLAIQIIAKDLTKRWKSPAGRDRSAVGTSAAGEVRQVAEQTGKDGLVLAGSTVAFVDSKGKEHNALVTCTHGWSGKPDEHEQMSINLVYVSDDENRQDDYGQQMIRESSVVHKGRQSASGMYWRLP